MGKKDSSGRGARGNLFSMTQQLVPGYVRDNARYQNLLAQLSHVHGVNKNKYQHLFMANVQGNPKYQNFLSRMNQKNMLLYSQLHKMTSQLRRGPNFKSTLGHLRSDDEDGIGSDLSDLEGDFESNLDYFESLDKTTKTGSPLSHSLVLRRPYQGPMYVDEDGNVLAKNNITPLSKRLNKYENRLKQRFDHRYKSARTHHIPTLFEEPIGNRIKRRVVVVVGDKSGKKVEGAKNSKSHPATKPPLATPSRSFRTKASNSIENKMKNSERFDTKQQTKKPNHNK